MVFNNIEEIGDAKKRPEHELDTKGSDKSHYISRLSPEVAIMFITPIRGYLTFTRKTALNFHPYLMFHTSHKTAHAHVEY
mgnify:CR=1 FL=1